MCGISAILELSEQSSEPVHDVLRMHRTLMHRGPDSEGFLFVDSHLRRVWHRVQLVEMCRVPLKLAVGFQRLSIQDPQAAANQPLARSGIQQWIVFNGEIYNFKELRYELEAQGYAFQTCSDTEVALAAYQCWGMSCFTKFNGM